MRTTVPRVAFARRYDEALGDMIREGAIALPPRSEGCVYHQYAITSPMRDHVQRRLTEAGIGTDVHYPLPCTGNPLSMAAKLLVTTSRQKRIS